MEDTLRVMDEKLKEAFLSLNPCSNGRYSQSQRAKPKNP